MNQNPEIDQTAFDVEAINTLMKSRRSIKPSQFSDRPVSDDIVRQMLINANWAPNHGLTEPWRFFVYTGDSRLALGKRLAEIYQEVTPLESYKPGKAAKLMTNAKRSSHLIVIAMQRQVSEKIPEVEEIEAVACAVQNLHLTATAYGVGGYWSSGTAICSQQLRNDLGLANKDRVLGMFYVGYTDEQWPEGSRRSIDDKVVWSR